MAVLLKMAYTQMKYGTFADAKDCTHPEMMTRKRADSGVSIESDLESGSSSWSFSKKEKRSCKPSSRMISDATLGMADGMTVPFALTAGLSAIGSNQVVVYGGLAELVAGMLAMGIGAYLSAKSEAASYVAKRREVERMIIEDPQTVSAQIRDTYEPYQMPFKIVEETIEYITRSPHQLDFLMQICHHETEPESSRLWLSGVTVGGGYFCGGITSLLPYFWSRNVFEGLVTSICIMSVALLLFGYSKTCLISGWSGRQNIRLGVLGAVEMLFVGGCAVGAAYGLVVIANKLGGLD